MIEKNYVIWRTYHDDNLINKYDLKENNHIKLFGTHLDYNGININYASKILCEVCTLYYVWKNYLYSDLIGFDHYGRQIKYLIIDDEQQCQVYDKWGFPPYSIKEQYCICHNEKTFNIALDIIKNKYGKSFYNLCCNTSILYPCCSFIMGWNNFNKLCEFLFSILFEIDEYYRGGFDIKKYIKLFHDEYQARQLAFLSERLISFWIEYNFDVSNIKIYLKK